MSQTAAVLYPYNDYTTEFVVDRAGTDGSYTSATGLTTLTTHLALSPEPGAASVHPTLELELVEVEPGRYQATYDGGDLAGAFPQVVAGESVEVWEILSSNLDLRVVRKLKVKPLRVVR